jgi:hypothetical protein
MVAAKLLESVGGEFETKYLNILIGKTPSN